MNNIKPISFKVSKSENHALLVQVDEGDRFYTHFHQHPEFQITAIVKGEGVLYAGNNISSYEEGEVIFVGSNVPHLLKTTPLNSIKNAEGVKGITLFFDRFSFGMDFFEIKEMFHIQQLLADSKRVIKIKGEFRDLIYSKVISTPYLQNEQLVITFLEILSLLASSKKVFLHTKHYDLKLDNQIGDRLNDVLEYTFKNSNKEITIEEISEFAHLSRSQFSHFFKLHTGKSYIYFLNEIRIEQACLLLKNDKLSINQICYSTGFNNVSNFIRQFKKFKNMTPAKFKKSWHLE